MDLRALNVKNPGGVPCLPRNHFPRASTPMGGMMVFDINVLGRRRRPSSACGDRVDSCRSLLVRALAKKNTSNSPSPGNDDHSTPEADGLKGGNSSDSDKSNQPDRQKPHLNEDWREFRAKLFAWEQAEKSESGVHDEGANHGPKPLGTKWAHPVPVPETGCILVATEKLDGVPTFERTVVLLLRAGTRRPQEGPFGVVINRPLHKKIKDMNPTNHDLATYFANCHLHFGGPLHKKIKDMNPANYDLATYFANCHLHFDGPLEANIFLLKKSSVGKPLCPKCPAFEDVVPGLSFGAINSLEEAAAMVRKGQLKPQDFRFFMGYAGWQFDQLKEEIESNYWYVAACSLDLICGNSSSSSSGSWEEILQLMGGHYSELSRKPKQDM
ncbi:hypothetical protein SAY86_004902 [Trapa natans]|uniref:Uncharacterized protein n=1 Tax=Trapa natans TaxID=22666 RepID=A0AAN7RJB4_TRANT|nr:hypothetical protein SAY86_004902 [Trapa natans]